MKDITKRFQDINEERRMFELRTSVTEKQGEDALRTSSSLLSPLKDLTYLRYLNLHGNSVTSLPNFICGLKKLQILKLEYFGSHNLLPKDLTPLQDLRHLVIYRCPSIADMPLNIGMLSHLRTLSTFIVDSKSGYGLDAKQSNFISKKKLNR
ncbi:hypothetical protein JHK85_001894 [Glycine max]|nr:hypothetical protein JHK85_001894 [Glycine max]